MDALGPIHANLLTPAVLFFVLGLLAAAAKSDLKFPEPVYAALTRVIPPLRWRRSFSKEMPLI